MKRVPWWVLVVLVGVAVVYGRCERAAGARDARLVDSSAATDRRVVVLLQENLELRATVAVFDRKSKQREALSKVYRDSLISEVGRLEALVPDTGMMIPRVAHDSLVGALETVIRADSAENRHLAGERDFWRMSYDAQARITDSLSTQLTALRDQREAWRRRVPSSTERWATFAGGALVGYGLAEENEVIVLVGAVTVLAPKVMDVVRRIF